MFRTLRILSVVALGLLSAGYVSGSDPEEGDGMPARSAPLPTTVAEALTHPGFDDLTAAQKRVLTFSLGLPLEECRQIGLLLAVISGSAAEVSRSIAALPAVYADHFASSQGEVLADESQPDRERAEYQLRRRVPHFPAGEAETSEEVVRRSKLPDESVGESEDCCANCCHTFFWWWPFCRSR